MRSIEKRWNHYYELTQGNPPQKTAVAAVEHLRSASGPPRTALDLGSGAGSDSVLFLEKGFQVTALDREARAHKVLRNRLSDPLLSRLTTVVSSIEDYGFRAEHFGLINASFSLLFLKRQNFRRVWDQIRHALSPHGVFGGHLFGTSDDWAGNPEMTFLSEAEVQEALRGFQILMAEETKERGTVADGSAKFWHYWSLVAVKCPDVAHTGESGGAP